MTLKKTLRTVRSTSYRIARDTGDVQAAAKGPIPLSKRYVRKAVYRRTNGLLGKLLRKGGR